MQGELAKDGGKKVYKNVLDVFVKTWKHEGLRGIQRGLGPAVSLTAFYTDWIIEINTPPVLLPSEKSLCYVLPMSLIHERSC